MTCGRVLHGELFSQSVTPAGGCSSKPLFCVTQKEVRVEMAPSGGRFNERKYDALDDALICICQPQ